MQKLVSAPALRLNDVRTPTWMVLERGFAICGFDLVSSRGPFEIEDLVGVDGGRLALYRIFVV